MPAHHGDGQRAVQDGQTSRAAIGWLFLPLFFLSPLLPGSPLPSDTPHLSNRTDCGLRHAIAQVATFIVQKILLDEMGLNYICATAERFYAVSAPRTVAAEPCAESQA